MSCLVFGQASCGMRLDGSEGEEVFRYNQAFATMNIAGDTMLLSVNNDGKRRLDNRRRYGHFGIQRTFDHGTVTVLG